MRIFTPLIGGLIACTMASSAVLAQTPAKKKGGHAELMEHFKAADKNGDGALSKAELAAADAKQFPVIRQHFDEMDSNHDGKVTMAERDAWAKAHPKQNAAKKERQATK